MKKSGYLYDRFSSHMILSCSYNFAGHRQVSLFAWKYSNTSYILLITYKKHLLHYDLYEIVIMSAVSLIDGPKTKSFIRPFSGPFDARLYDLIRSYIKHGILPSSLTLQKTNFRSVCHGEHEKYKIIETFLRTVHRLDLRSVCRVNVTTSSCHILWPPV